MLSYISPAASILGEHERDRCQIPVLVQLKGSAPVLEAICNELERGDLELEPKEIKRLLRHQRLILLFDGVNEIPTELLRQQLQEFRDAYPQTPMIFTTRDLAIGGSLGINKQLEMKPLSPEQLKEFVGKRLGEDGDRLLGQLHGKLPELAETPLLLKMLCDVFDPETGKIPESKGELFQWFSQKFDNWKEREGVRTSEKFWQWNKELLQNLALVMIQNNGSVLPQPSIDRDEIAKILEKHLTGRVANPGERAKDWRDDLIDFHLLQDAAEPGKIEFHHQLFQEYYAAEALLGMFRDRHRDMVEPERFQHFYLNYLNNTPDRFQGAKAPYWRRLG